VPPELTTAQFEPDTFLGSLTADELHAFQNCGRAVRFSSKETLFREGDDPGGVIAILSGRMKISIAGVGGRDVVLRLPGPGELVGEIAAVAGRPRSATVESVNDVEGISVRAADFRRFISEQPRVATLIFEHVTALLSYADRQRADLATRDVTGRVASRLLELAADAEDPSATPPGSRASGKRIMHSLSQEELAAWSGASREAVAKSLQLLRDLGWVSTGRREITLLDEAALRTLVDSAG
jgi:CRP/FNR family transcriptional regulator, cyclic AMP receptor protein